MTWRRLLACIFSDVHDLDSEAKIRLVSRDLEGCVITFQHVPIASFSDVQEAIRVEMSDIQKAPVEKA